MGCDISSLPRRAIVNKIFDFLEPQDRAIPDSTVVSLYKRITAHSQSPDQLSAAKVFWGLKGNWWKQIIDGHYHDCGPMVFDKGLHFEDKVEPGYFKGILNACRFISYHFCELPTPELYKRIHAIACSHFEGAKTNTLITAQATGQFRQREANLSLGCSVNFFDADPNFPPEREALLEDMNILFFAEGVYKETDPREWNQVFIKLGFTREDDFKIAVKHAKVVLNKFNHHVAKRVAQLNAEIQKRSAELGVEPIAVVSQLETTYPWKMKIEYKNDRVEPIVNQLFNNYAANIRKAKSDDEKILAVADLYQMLEWLHPFKDGQGRTDIILKEKLLCDCGLTPSILDAPYFSTFAPLNEWFTYLKEGMDRWKKERSNQNQQLKHNI